jgi:Tfp pilus assembly protein PilV
VILYRGSNLSETKVTSKQKLNSSGFGLMEVVVTLFLISITLLMFQVTSQAIVLNKYGRYKEIALRIADQEIQTLRTTAFADLPPTGSFSDPQMASIPNGQGQLLVDDLNNLLKDVTVTVTWTNPSSEGIQQVELRTYITNGGIGQ